MNKNIKFKKLLIKNYMKILFNSLEIHKPFLNHNDDSATALETHTLLKKVVLQACPS